MIQHGMPVRGPSSAGLIRLTAATPTDPGNGSGYRLPRLLAALVAGMRRSFRIRSPVNEK
jgi:hypothetical protein